MPGGGRTVEDARELGGQLRAVNQDAILRIQLCGTEIDVVGADEDRLAVDDQDLGVKRGAGGVAFVDFGVLAGALGVRAEFKEIDSRAKKVFAVTLVGALNCNNVVGRRVNSSRPLS